MELMNRRLLAAQSKNVAYKACTSVHNSGIIFVVPKGGGMTCNVYRRFFCCQKG